jgi:hypothetical protein
MSFEEADREMRPPARCYQSSEEIEADTQQFLREAWGDDLRKFAWASFAWTSQGWCPVPPEAGRMEMVQSLYVFQMSSSQSRCWRAWPCLRSSL